MKSLSDKERDQQGICKYWPAQRQGERLLIQLQTQEQQKELYAEDQNPKPVHHFFELGNNIQNFYSKYDATLLHSMCV